MRINSLLLTAVLGSAIAAPLAMPLAAFSQEIGDRITNDEDVQVCGWTRYIYNEGEPDNAIRFEGWRDPENGDCVGDSMRFNGRFSDGFMTATIYPTPLGWAYNIDDKEGVATSFKQAFLQMPALLTDPDHFVDGDRW